MTDADFSPEGVVKGLPEEIDSQRNERGESALRIVEQGLERIDRIAEYVGVPFVGNQEVRSQNTLPPGVMLAAEATSLEEVRAAKRIITHAEDSKIRLMAVELGVARERDVVLSESGLPLDATQTAEGGQVHGKIKAQKSLILEAVPLTNGDDARIGEAEATGEIIQCATKCRELATKSGEVEAVRQMFTDVASSIERSRHILDRLGINPDNLRTEWDGAVMVWITDPNFVPSEQPRVIERLDVKGRAASEGITGELIEIGTIHGRGVYMQEVPRVYDTEQGESSVPDPKLPKTKYRQPNAAILAATHASLFNKEAAAVVTGSTYLPETIAEITEVTYDLAVSGDSGVQLAPIAYSPARLAQSKGEEVKPTSLAQIFGAVNKTSKVYRRLYEKIAGRPYLPAQRA